jgi:hypothetical protein
MTKGKIMDRFEFYKFPKELKSAYNTYGIGIGNYENVKFIEIMFGRRKFRFKYVPKVKWSQDDIDKAMEYMNREYDY